MARERKDYFYRRAKAEGYRARSAFKLQQINKRFRLIRRGDAVLDLGAAPGGWLQVAKEISGGRVVGVDLQAIEPIDGVTTIRADITAPETLDLIRDALGGEANVVICDAAPNLSGNWTLDHARSIDLSSSALRVAKEVLKPGGNFLVKVFQGDTFLDYLSEVRVNFRRAQSHSPAASRKESAEMYVIGQGFFSPPVKVGDVLELEIVGVGKSGDGFGEVEGFKVFLPGAAPGDRVQVRIRSIRSGHAMGTVEITRAEPESRV
jgi:23S rRNA (uridine2552-2'-O)-methyltransferase